MRPFYTGARRIALLLPKCQNFLVAWRMVLLRKRHLRMSMKLYTIIQVLPTDDYRVYLYFVHGEIRLYDATEILVHGVFRVLKDKKIFAESCTVLNNTLAWDVKGNFDPYECLDLDPGVLYEKSIRVDDPLLRYA